MFGGMILIAAVIAVAVVVILALLSEGRQRSTSVYEAQRDEMPVEIADARLVMSEDKRILKGRAGRFQLMSKPDQVFLTRDNRLVCVENKTRGWFATYFYDTIELSVQALGLSQSRPRELRNAVVADYGYVRAINRVTGESRFFKVELMGQQALEGLAERYHAIRCRSLTPTAQKNPKACQRCQFAMDCEVRAR